MDLGERDASLFPGVLRRTIDIYLADKVLFRHINSYRARKNVSFIKPIPLKIVSFNKLAKLNFLICQKIYKDIYYPEKRLPYKNPFYFKNNYNGV